MDDEFGEAKDLKKTYRRIQVFDSDEDVEEFDKEQEELRKEAAAAIPGGV
jgi:hypothetical protein